MTLDMISKYSAMQSSLIMTILITILGFIVWYFPVANINEKSKTTPNQFINKLTKLALYCIWLIGVSVALMVLGLVVGWYTFDSFLWAPFETILILSLGVLFIIPIVIARNIKGQSKKEKGDGIHEHIKFLVKHLVMQMKLVIAVIIICILKFYF